jgi:predicted esterase
MWPSPSTAFSVDLSFWFAASMAAACSLSMPIGCTSRTGTADARSVQPIATENARIEQATSSEQTAGDAGALDARPEQAPSGKMATLDIPGFLDAVLWVPGDDVTVAKPVVVATHGAYDNPESYCPFWRKIVEDRAFVVCTRGKRIQDGAFYYPDHFFIDREDEAALAALASRFGSRVAPGPVLYAGYSQGAIHGAPLLQMRPKAHPRAVLIEGGSRWNASTAAQYRAAGGERLLFVCGTEGCRSGATRAVAIVAKAGIDVDFIWVPGAGHDYPPEMGARLSARFGWLVAGDRRWSAE